jgi:hypothetical protein
MGRRFALLGAGVALAATAACGGGSTAADDAEPTLSISSPPSSPRPTVPADLPARPQPPKHSKSKAGAEAFARYVVETIWYAASTHETKALFALDANGTCTSCRVLDKQLDRDAWQVPVANGRAPAEVTRVDLYDVDGPVRLLGVMFDNPRHKIVEADGDVVDHLPARTRQYVDVGLTWQDGQWVLNNYRYAKD